LLRLAHHQYGVGVENGDKLQRTVVRHYVHLSGNQTCPQRSGNIYAVTHVRWTAIIAYHAGNIYHHLWPRLRQQNTGRKRKTAKVKHHQKCIGESQPIKTHRRSSRLFCFSNFV